jgi:cytoskeletal protein CcmA (bactofilin family)
MAMFGKDAPTRAEARPSGAAVEAVLSIVAPGMTITGDVQTAGVLKVDGEINGSVIGARQVLLGRNGVVRGNISAGEVVVGGSVEGSVSAQERLELQSTASVSGDIDTRSIVVIEGARINGMVRMSEGVGARQEPLRLARG